MRPAFAGIDAGDWVDPTGKTRDVTVRLDNQHRFTMTFNDARANYTESGTAHSTTIGGAIEGGYTSSPPTLAFDAPTATLFAATDGKALH